MNETNNEAPHFQIAFIIVKRGAASRALDVAHKAGALGGTIFMGRGTAKSHILALWGLEKEHDYEIIMISLHKIIVEHVVAEVSKTMKLSEPGRGIMFTLPSSGSAGLAVLRRILAEKGIQIPDITPVNKEEITKMQDGCKYSLIISITNRGFADEAMDAAREAGATGGIIINGRGAGLSAAASFFGMMLESEREILMNLVEKSKVSGILEAIVRKTGLKTEARGISFVLPVDQATGLVRLDEID